MGSKSTVLLEHHLKGLKRPSFLWEYRKMAVRCPAENVDHRSTCSVSPNWNSSTATSAWWSGGSGRHDSLPSRALYLDLGLESSLNGSGFERGRPVESWSEEAVVQRRSPLLNSVDPEQSPRLAKPASCKDGPRSESLGGET